MLCGFIDVCVRVVPACTLASLLSELTRSAEDAMSTALQSVFTHIENNNSYIKRLFVDFSIQYNLTHETDWKSSQAVSTLLLK